MSTLQDIKPTKVTVNINGEDKELKFNLNAYANIEEELCLAMPDAFNLLYSGSMKAMRIFLWAGLLHLDKNINMEQVGEIDNFEGLMDSLNTAIDASMPKSSEDE